MIKQGKTLAVMALAMSATFGVGAAQAGDNYRTSGTTNDPGYGRLSEGMSFQDWINHRQQEGTLGNAAVVRTYDDDAYVRRSLPLIVPTESTLPPNFTRSDMVGESPGTVIVVPKAAPRY